MSEPAVRLAPTLEPDPLLAVEEPTVTDVAGRLSSPTPAVEPLLGSAAAASRLCGVSEATWYRLAASGRTPAPIRLSRGCVRWRLDELREWIAAGCPSRREGEARRTAAKAGGRPRQAGR